MVTPKDALTGLSLLSSQSQQCLAGNHLPASSWWPHPCGPFSWGLGLLPWTWWGGPHSCLSPAARTPLMLSPLCHNCLKWAFSIRPFLAELIASSSVFSSLGSVVEKRLLLTYFNYNIIDAAWLCYSRSGKEERILIVCDYPSAQGKLHYRSGMYLRVIFHIPPVFNSKIVIAI